MVLTVKKEILHVGTWLQLLQHALSGQRMGPLGVVKLISDLQQGNTRGHHRNRVSRDLTQFWGKRVLWKSVRAVDWEGCAVGGEARGSDVCPASLFLNTDPGTGILFLGRIDCFLTNMIPKCFHNNFTPHRSPRGLQAGLHPLDHRDSSLNSLQRRTYVFY